MGKRRVILVIVLVALLTSACAADPNELAGTENAEGEIAGFWLGLWQGFISPFAFIVSLFSENVGIYEVHNNGNWYNLGFMIGVSAIFGGSGGGAASRRR